MIMKKASVMKKLKDSSKSELKIDSSTKDTLTDIVQAQLMLLNLIEKLGGVN